MTFGKYLKITRLGTGLTQRGLAKKIGISNVQLSYYERDKRFPNSKTMKILIRTLKLDRDLLKIYIIKHYIKDALNYFAGL